MSKNLRGLARFARLMGTHRHEGTEAPSEEVNIKIFMLSFKVLRRDPCTSRR